MFLPYLDELGDDSSSDSDKDSSDEGTKKSMCVRQKRLKNTKRQQKS